MQSAYTTYKNVTVDTADQGKLILISYDVAIKSCKIALEKFDDPTLIEERTKALFKAQDAITELMVALRMDVGEISRNLYRLYEYFLHRLVQANVKSESAPVQEIVGYLVDLRDAWSQAILSLKKEALVTTPVEALESFAITG